MVVLGIFWRDAIDQMIDLQFDLVERGNATVTFPHPMDRAIIRDLAREPGVLAVEGQRIVPVRLRAGHRSYLTSVVGLAPSDELRRPHDAARRPIQTTPDTIMLTRRLAERLEVGPGELITVEAMEGGRKKRDLPVSATADESIGMASYMDIATLNRFTDEGAAVSAATLYVEPTALAALAGRFKNLPTIESVTMKASTLSSFLEKIAGLVFVSAGILTAFAAIITVGVVYNSARISLQERAWELASLRVLGFTRGEVASILLGEFATEIALGIPIGLWLSHGVVTLIAKFHSNESFQIPAVIGTRTYLIAATWSRLSRRGNRHARQQALSGGRRCDAGLGRVRRLGCYAKSRTGRDSSRDEGPVCGQGRGGRQDPRTRAVCRGCPAGRPVDADQVQGRRSGQTRRRVGDDRAVARTADGPAQPSGGGRAAWRRRGEP
jgi:putative ABC transport system permease protein